MDMTAHLNQATDVSLRPVAHGGAADIYLAILADGRRVAVKCLRQAARSESEDLKVYTNILHLRGRIYAQSLSIANFSRAYGMVQTGS